MPGFDEARPAAYRRVSKAIKPKPDLFENTKEQRGAKKAERIREENRVAALIWKENPDLTPREVGDIIAERQGRKSGRIIATRIDKPKK